MGGARGSGNCVQTNCGYGCAGEVKVMADENAMESRFLESMNRSVKPAGVGRASPVQVSVF
jgi:hypothetical protein